MAADANRRVRVTASARRNEWPVARQTIQFDTEMAAPESIRRRTPTGTRSLLRSECEWKQGESSDGVFYREGRNRVPPVGRQGSIAVKRKKNQEKPRKTFSMKKE